MLVHTYQILNMACISNLIYKSENVTKIIPFFCRFLLHLCYNEPIVH